MPMMNASPVDIDIQWEAPSHWMLKDTGSGMRAGSYGIPDSAFFGMGELNPEAVDVSITHFAGDAGGLGPNTQRWMGQVGIHLDSAALKGFLARAKKFRTQTGDEGMIIDLTEMLSGDLTQSQTIYGAIIPWKGATVFVKAIGERSRVIMAREDIFAFCESLRLKEGEN